jgi:S1-C subfamily serine protease
VVNGLYEVSSATESRDKWKIISFFLVLIIILNSAFFIYTYVSFTKQFTDLNNEYTKLQEMIQESQDDILRLQNDLDIIKYINHSEIDNVVIPKVFELIKDSVVLIKTNLGQGSGFVYDKFGHIITNYHVVEDSSEISITFTDGNITKATIVGTDIYSDIAVVKVNVPSDILHPIILGDSSLLIVGEPVVAIGNPFGLSSTITAGIISQVGRELETPGGYMIVDVIQLDAAINPGNSGGPLVNMRGEVIGMNTAIVSGSTGVGFAIPSDTVKREIQSLITNGIYEHSWLGISGYSVDSDIADTIDLNYTYGFFIAEVILGAPAYSAGLQGEDVIIVIDSEIIRNSNDLAVYLQRNSQPGDNLSVTIIRNQKKILIDVVLGVRPPP